MQSILKKKQKEEPKNPSLADLLIALITLVIPPFLLAGQGSVL
jgi:hypothetical protein